MCMIETPSLFQTEAVLKTKEAPPNEAPPDS